MFKISAVGSYCACEPQAGKKKKPATPLLVTFTALT